VKYQFSLHVDIEATDPETAARLAQRQMCDITHSDRRFREAVLVDSDDEAECITDHGCTTDVQTTYHFLVNLALEAGWTAAAAEIEPADLRDHLVIREAYCRADAREKAIDRFHAIVPIGNLEGAVITIRTITEEESRKIGTGV